MCITDCVEGEVRLVGGETDSEGTIEVCLNSVWGLITDAGWDQNDAHVVCRQLNLPTDGVCVCVSVLGTFKIWLAGDLSKKQSRHPLCNIKLMLSNACFNLSLS